VYGFAAGKPSDTDSTDDYDDISDIKRHPESAAIAESSESTASRSLKPTGKPYFVNAVFAEFPNQTYMALKPKANC
jgi:hypothetical protein